MPEIHEDDIQKSVLTAQKTLDLHFNDEPVNVV
jgi:hypothetical protein